MIKLLTEETLQQWDNTDAVCRIVPVLLQIKQWCGELGDSWYDDIIYQTLDRVGDILLDNIVED